MKQPVRERLFLEQLEDRWCPALNISNSGGLLYITGTPTSGTVTITATATPNRFSVMDGILTKTFSNVTNINVSLSGTVAGNGITVDLTLGKLLGNLTLDGGGSLGSNSLSLTGDGLPATKDVLGNTSVSRMDFILASNADIAGGLTVNNGARSQGTLMTLSNDTVGKPGSFTGGSGADTFNLIATSFLSSLNVSLGAGPNTFNFDSSSQVNTSLTYNGTTGDQTVNFDGTVLGYATVGMGNGDNTLEFSGFVGGAFSITGGNGSNTIGAGAFTGTVNGNLTFNFGNGVNSVNFAATVLGNVTYRGGSGSNSLTIDAPATVPASSRFTVIMGPGTNSLLVNSPIDAKFILFIQ